MFVSQQHTVTMFSVAACLARVADAEWLRACEEVRRISPSVGSVGEWRALCEGDHHAFSRHVFTHPVHAWDGRRLERARHFDGEILRYVMKQVLCP